ncbi:MULTISPECIES: DUF6515 family protein [unclassified Olleya]|uniref:DUF6515 family protein n=1 Tax=unclassified Olleya TaxID=2615019 RepID=UPI000C308584|nr:MULTISPECIES: DUF6515 family protein [unclassified Olleya]AUC76549.1 hypothetical protein CW732_13060 [Olleya sp. Bg11-27]QXP58861.1 hypothetical protein H0I26_13180 [Olleya sp. HaHaR_3_96]
MKTLIKTYVLPVAFLLALTVQVSAQNRRDTKEKTTKTTKAVTKRTVAVRVPSHKVTYKTPKKKVVAVRTVPNRTVINHKGHNYYYSKNKFYTQSRGRYIVIAPKVGFRIQVLPANHKRVRFNNHNYFNVSGIFYTQVNNEYEVVEPEVGTVVYELPEDYEKVVLNDQTYYEYANVLYEKVQVNGTRAYEVVGIIDMD